MNKKILSIGIIAILIGLGIGTFLGIQGAKTIPESNASVDKINSTKLLVEKSLTKEKIDQITLNKQNKRDLKRLADMIVLGSISEDQFFELNLSEKDVVEVFKNIRDQRNWKMDDKYLTFVIREALNQRKNEKDALAILSGECSQRVEKESGSTGSVYPYRRVSPIGNECGGDPDDFVLEYNTYWGPSTNPDNAKWWSNYWYIRFVVGACYPSGLSASGLCTTNTRVCMGSCASYLGNDVMWVYLWHK